MRHWPLPWWHTRPLTKSLLGTANSGTSCGAFSASQHVRAYPNPEGSTPPPLSLDPFLFPENSHFDEEQPGSEAAVCQDSLEGAAGGSAATLLPLLILPVFPPPQHLTTGRRLSRAIIRSIGAIGKRDAIREEAHTD